MHHTQRPTGNGLDLNIRLETVTLLGEIFLEISLGSDFLGMTPKAQATKAEIDKWGFFLFHFTSLPLIHCFRHFGLLLLYNIASYTVSWPLHPLLLFPAYLCIWRAGALLILLISLFKHCSSGDSADHPM
jgi:hypothetical protein